MAAASKVLGQFDLAGITPAPRGTPQIEVTLDIDANGMVSGSAKHKGTAKRQTLRIQASGGLTEADIQRMVREAEAHAEEAKRRKEVVEARNQADATIYGVENTLKETPTPPAGLKAELEQAIAALRDAMKTEDVQRIRQATDRLSQTALRLAEAGQAAAADAGATSGAQDESGVGA